VEGKRYSTRTALLVAELPAAKSQNGLFERRNAERSPNIGNQLPLGGVVHHRQLVVLVV
jgi:hypothetical protein